MWERRTNEYEEKKSIFNGSMYFILFVTFASLFYIIKEENHNCTGEDCPICANIHQAEQTLRNLGAGMVIHATVNPVLFMFVLAIAGQAFVVSNTSLVSQKVRLNN